MTFKLWHDIIFFLCIVIWNIIRDINIRHLSLNEMGTNFDEGENKLWLYWKEQTSYL